MKAESGAGEENSKNSKKKESSKMSLGLKRRLLFFSATLTLLLLLASATTIATTIRGTIYNDDLTIATNVLVTINSTPSQRLLSKDGKYEFELTKGSYTLNATKGNVTTSEKVVVNTNGEFRYDLFLFPNIDEEENLYNAIDTDLKDAPVIDETSSMLWPLITILMIIIIVLAGPLIFIYKRFAKLDEMRKREERKEKEKGYKKEEKKRYEEEEDENDLAKKVLKILKEKEGRMTQRELRKSIPYSEAKVSLVISELEAKGKLQKIKKGRGNILLLKK